jgi:hypothetical protein
MGVPRTWEGEENVTLQRKMEYLVREIMSSLTSLDMPCEPRKISEDDNDSLINKFHFAHHSYNHSQAAMKMAREIQQDILTEKSQQAAMKLAEVTHNYYFTFGVGDLKHCNHFVRINATDYHTAREVMSKAFGTKWAFQYTEEEWFNKHGISQAEVYGYEELILP